MRLSLFLGALGLLLANATAPAAEHVFSFQSGFGAFGGGAGQLNGPSGIAIDPFNRDFVVADSDNHRLQRFSAGGTYLGQIGEPGPGDGQFGFSLGGVAIDPRTRNIVVVDRHLSRIQVFASSGAFLTKFGGFGSALGQLAHPDGVAVDAVTGDIVVADADNHRVQVFAPDGSPRIAFGAQGSGDGEFIRPAGIAVDPASRNILVVDQRNHRVQAFGPSGRYLWQFGGLGSDAGRFTNPTAIAIDPANGDILVGDMANLRVQVFDAHGAYRGEFGSAGSGDGQFALGLDLFGGGPTLTGVLGLAVDPVSRSVGVTDWGNSRVQLFSRPFVPQTGWWWNPAESGRGYFLERNAANVIFVASFLYASTGRATWHAAALAEQALGYSGELDRYHGGQTLEGRYQPPSVEAGAAGPLRLTFADATRGTLTWAGGTIPIQRFMFADTQAGLFQPQSGWWWNAAESGRGYSIEVQGNRLFLAGYMYDASGEPVWYLSSGTLSGQDYQGTWVEYANGQTATGPYNAPTIVKPDAGALAIHFTSPTAAVLTLPNGRSIAISRFTF